MTTLTATWTVKKLRGHSLWMVIHPNGSVFKTCATKRDADWLAQDKNNGGW